MIGRIKGILLKKQAPMMIVEVGGIGYEIYAPMTTFYKLPDIGREIILHTHLVVREDSQTLYGFIEERALNLFRALIKTTGIGPKLALTILSGIEPDSFVQCIKDNDITGLIKLPGIGKKTAERLLIEMRDRLQDWQIDYGTVAFDAGIGVKDAISALVALGYKPQEAQKAVAQYKDQNLSSEELIRLALKNFN